MGVVEINQLLATLNIFSGTSWANMFKGLWALIGRVVYSIIVIALGRIADVCQMVFKKLAGIGSGVRLGNQAVEGDIVLAFLNEKIIQHIFFALLILAVVILLITTFVATIKTEFNKDGNNNKRIVIKNAFRGLANFVLVPIICIFGLFVGNALLRALDGATNPSGTQTTLSSQIFLAGGYNANRARNSENNDPNSNRPYINGSFGAVLTGNRPGGGAGVGNFGVFFDDDPNSLNPYRAADKIDEAFSKGLYIQAGVGVGSITQNLGFVVLGREAVEEYGLIGSMLGLETSIDSNTLSYSAAGIWNGGFFTSDIKIGSFAMQANNSSIDYNWFSTGNGVFKFKEGDIIPFSLYNIGLVYYYYDTNLGGFSYLISAIALIFCCYVLLVSALGLVKRLFYLTMLFVISAPVCATYPLDNGDILKRWRTEFIKNALSAYSVIVVLNLFLCILPLIVRLKLFASSDFLIPGIGASFANYISRILIVIGALLFFKDAVAKLAEIIGAGDVNGDGNKIAKDVGRKAAVGAGLAIGGAAVASKLTAKAAKGVYNGISNMRSAHKDKKFAEENKADYEARNQVAAEKGGKAGADGSGNSSNNSMNFTAKDGYNAPDISLGKKDGDTNKTASDNSKDLKSTVSEDSKATNTGSNSKSSDNSFNTGAGDNSKDYVRADDKSTTDNKSEPIDWHAERLKAEHAKKASKYDKKHGEGSYDKHKQLNKLRRERMKRHFGFVGGVVKKAGSAVAGTASVISAIAFNNKFGYKSAYDAINHKKTDDEKKQIAELKRKKKVAKMYNSAKIKKTKEQLKDLKNDSKK